MRKLIVMLLVLLANSVVMVAEDEKNGLFDSFVFDEAQAIEKAKRVALAEKYARLPLAIRLIIDNQTDKKIRVSGDTHGAFSPWEKREFFVEPNSAMSEGKYFFAELTENGKKRGQLFIYFEDKKNIFSAVFESKFVPHSQFSFLSVNEKSVEDSIDLPHGGKKIRGQVLLTLKGDDLSESTVEIEDVLVGDPEEQEEQVIVEDNAFKQDQLNEM